MAIRFWSPPATPVVFRDLSIPHSSVLVHRNHLRRLERRIGQ